MSLQDFKEEQPQVVSLLLEGLRHSRLSHAYLFYGPEGVGKGELALELARAVSCRESLDACDQCLSCQKIAQSNHPDVQIISPQEGSIKINQIRHLQQEIYYQPYEGEKKVYVMKESHLMTLQAQNCLLKTLEAPPHYAILILVTSNKDALLSTILSRCQRVLFRGIQGAVLSRRLQEEYDLSFEEASIYRDIKADELLLAQQQDRGAEVWTLREDILTDFSLLMEGGYTDIFMTIKKIEKEYSEKIELVFSIFLSLFRDLLFLKSGVEEGIINTDYQNKLESFLPSYTFRELQRMLEIVLKTYGQIRQNALKRLALEAMWLKIRGKGDLEDEKGGLDYL